jgi:hypothetical protein
MDLRLQLFHCCLADGPWPLCLGLGSRAGALTCGRSLTGLRMSRHRSDHARGSHSKHLTEGGAEMRRAGEARVVRRNGQTFAAAGAAERSVHGDQQPIAAERRAGDSYVEMPEPRWGKPRRAGNHGKTGPFARVGMQPSDRFENPRVRTGPNEINSATRLRPHSFRHCPAAF